MMPTILLSFLYPPSPSLFLGIMSVLSFVALSFSGLSEISGKHLQYSKFWNADHPPRPNPIVLSGRTGMLLLYTPAFVAAVASFGVPGVVINARSQLLSLALGVHFFKRVFEVLFIHKYSGQMVLNSAIAISSSYFLCTVNMIYAQYLTQGIPEPTINLKCAGVVLFLVGIIGNFYHHLLLSKLRVRGDKRYKIPEGGLFSLVICPHYLFEIIDFVGISLISPTVYAFFFTLGTTFYLMGRSYATRKWYLSKFDNFPKNVKALIPYVF